MDESREGGPESELYLCMGSACHQMGVYQVLPELQRLLAESGLDGAVVLKGAFCLECCSDGIVLRHSGRLIRFVNPRNVAERFRAEILPRLRSELAGENPSA